MVSTARSNPTSELPASTSLQLWKPCSRATVLHYAGSNGVESYRQVVPLNLADIVDFLIRAGADPQAEATIYGGSTARALFESSTHPIQANVHEKVAAVFQEHGV